jgi:hypothetical protein
LVFGGSGLVLGFGFVLGWGFVVAAAGGHGFVGVSGGRVVVVVVEAALFLERALVWFAGVAAVEMRSRLGRMKRATRWKARG